jgi:manganese/zinc/iron transport system permease protein
MIAAVVMAFLTTFLTQFLIAFFRLREDVSCGIVFTFLFALGVIAVTLISRSAHIGTELLMGSADSLDIHDFYLQSVSVVVNVGLVTAFYRGFFVTSFDPIFSHVLAFSPALFGYMLMGLTSLTATAAFRAVGVLMVLALFVGPPLIARLFTHRLLPLIVLSCVIGLITAISSVALARHLLSVWAIPVSTSALLVSIIFITYLFALLINRRRA